MAEYTSTAPSTASPANCWCHTCDQEVVGIPEEDSGEMACSQCGNNFVELLEDNAGDHPADFAAAAASAPSTAASATQSSTASAPSTAMPGAGAGVFPQVPGSVPMLLAAGGGGGGGGNLGNILSSALQQVFSSFGGGGGFDFSGLAGGAGGQQGSVFGDYAVGNMESLIAQLMQADPNRYGPPPAAADVMEKLERYTLDEGHEDVGVECPIMKMDFEVGDEVVRLPCGHKFSPDGIEHWLKEHNNCPVCRMELPTSDEEYNRNKGLSWDKMEQITRDTKKEEAEEAEEAAAQKEKEQTQ